MDFSREDLQIILLNNQKFHENRCRKKVFFTEGHKLNCAPIFNTSCPIQIQSCKDDVHKNLLSDCEFH